jgi:cytochrome c oxidase subunit IV
VTTHTPSDTLHSDNPVAEGHHPSEGQYVVIAGILAVLTGIEVTLSYLKIGGSQGITNGALLVLAAIKFAMVAMFFMHLRFDKPVVRRLFVTGLVLAVLVYIAYLLTLGVFVK